MNINYTLIGQAIAMAMFVWFSMKFVWPPLITAITQRQQKIAEGLSAADSAQAALANANEVVKTELDAAKLQAAQLIEQANRRAALIIDEARVQAIAEGERLRQQAKEAVDQEINQAREALRLQVSALAVEGAEKILRTSVTPDNHSAMLEELARQL